MARLDVIWLGVLMTDIRPVGELTFEQALAEMDAIVEKMRSSELTLQESVQAYTRGKELSKHCEALLNKAQAVVQKLDADGQLSPVTQEELREEGSF